MSGHSKFNNIKHRKEKNDRAKGKIFTIIGHELSMAIKQGGADPNTNSKLRDVIAKAKQNNMPNDTIEKGIKKAQGSLDSVNFEELTYEGYGVGGVAIIVNALTDNKNRTASDVRSAFTKGNGNLGTTGSVSFLFDKKGQIIISKEDCDLSFDKLMEIIIEIGAEDLQEEDEIYEIITSPDDFTKVREGLEKNNIKIEEANINMIPNTYVSIVDEENEKLLRRTIDLLNESDDVKDVFTNWEEE
ncbi:MAG: YebC/PmpR family DNA-binding transcriptional regulator [Eubacteriales bacterium]|nr:YebC/PmpR family DNA-binding transcriptional regulator [Eubacteriales bacterium]